MNVFDIFGNKPVEPLRYVTPCCSDRFNEQGTPIGYYVDALGREFPQEVIDKTYGQPGYFQVFGMLYITFHMLIFPVKNHQQKRFRGHMGRDGIKAVLI